MWRAMTSSSEGLRSEKHVVVIVTNSNISKEIFASMLAAGYSILELS